ncbi:hypothetical protein J6590_042158 [Homalodisca vitripennis]|nr:hypothetical protein J6590_042158 [Homalodisca vitripennis]
MCQSQQYGEREIGRERGREGVREGGRWHGDKATVNSGYGHAEVSKVQWKHANVCDEAGEMVRSVVQEAVQGLASEDSPVIR